MSQAARLASTSLRMQAWSKELHRPLKECLEIYAHSTKVERDGMTPSVDASSFTAQDGNLLQLLTRNLYGFDLDVVADAEFIDGDELIATF